MRKLYKCVTEQSNECHAVHFYLVSYTFIRFVLCGSTPSKIMACCNTILSCQNEWKIKIKILNEVVPVVSSVSQFHYMSCIIQIQIILPLGAIYIVYQCKISSPFIYLVPSGTLISKPRDFFTFFFLFFLTLSFTPICVQAKTKVWEQHLQPVLFISLWCLKLFPVIHTFCTSVHANRDQTCHSKKDCVLCK